MRFVQFDGSLSKQERERILEEFERGNAVFEQEMDDSELMQEISEDWESTRKRGASTPIAAKKRQKVETDGEFPRIMLISLRAGGVGLNLTSANTVFMCDPWWNEAVENQAINRVFRIGQKRKVKVFRLIIEDSIEEKIIKLQQKKEQLIQSTLDFQNATAVKLSSALNFVFSNIVSSGRKFTFVPVFLVFPIVGSNPSSNSITGFPCSYRSWWIYPSLLICTSI